MTQTPWLTCAGFIVGRSPIPRDFEDGVDPAVEELNRGFDGASWLRPTGAKALVWFVEFTHHGRSLKGHVESPLPVASIRRTRRAELWVTTNVPDVDLLERTGEQRSDYWRTTLRELLSEVARRRGLPPIDDFALDPSITSNAELLVLSLEHSGSPQEHEEAQCFVEVFFPLELAAANETNPWMGAIGQLIAANSGVSAYAPPEHQDGHWVLFLRGAADRVLLLAFAMASLPGVPDGAYAVIAQQAGRSVGAGPRIPLTPLK